MLRSYSVLASTPVLAAFFVASWMAPSHANAFCRITTDGDAQVGDQPCVERGAFLEWPSGCLTYAIDERGSRWMSLEESSAIIDEAFDTWASQPCGGERANLIFAASDLSRCQWNEVREEGGNVNTVAFLDPWVNQCGVEFDPRAFAVTLHWFDTSSGRIFDADILINDAQGPYARCPDSGCPTGTPTEPGPVDLLNVVTHEAGHFIGIGHSDVPEATMFAEAGRNEVSKRSLAQDDIDALCAIYPPGDLDTSCEPELIGGLDLDCEDDGAPNCETPNISAGGGCSAGGCSATRHDQGSAVCLGLLGIALLLARRRRLPRF